MRICVEFPIDDDDNEDGDNVTVTFTIDGITTVVSKDEGTTTSSRPTPALQESSKRVGTEEKSSHPEITAPANKSNDDDRARPTTVVPNIDTPNDTKPQIEENEKQVKTIDEPSTTPSSEIAHAPFQAPEQRVIIQNEDHQSGPAETKSSPPPIKVTDDRYRQGQAKHIRRPMRRKPPPWPSRLTLKRGIYSGGKMRQ